MEAFSYTSARANLRSLMDKTCDNHEPVIITRQNARSVVLMSLEDFNAWEETAYLLKSPKNTAKLLQSLAELEIGKTTEVSLKDLLE